VNQYGQQSKLKGPGGFNTIRRELIYPNKLAYPHPDYPGETELERGIRLRLVDVWKECVIFQLSANHSITYTGERAAVMWKAWSTFIYKKQQKGTTTKKRK